MSKLAAVLLTGFVAMGGWAVVTVRDLPEYLVAGQQYTIEFQVRQHGRTLLSGLRPELVVTSGSARGVVIPAAARSAPGTYAVTFTAPASGPATLTIRSGFGNNQLTLYPLAVVAGGGSKPALSVADRGSLPIEFALGANYPNPFNPSTKFTISLPHDAHVIVAVYNVLGEKVKTLIDEQESAGYHTVEWNGRTEMNVEAGSGLYFIRMMSERFSAVNKVLMMR